MRVLIWYQPFIMINGSERFSFQVFLADLKVFMYIYIRYILSDFFMPSFLKWAYSRNTVSMLFLFNETNIFRGQLP